MQSNERVEPPFPQRSSSYAECDSPVTPPTPRDQFLDNYEHADAGIVTDGIDLRPPNSNNSMEGQGSDADMRSANSRPQPRRAEKEREEQPQLAGRRPQIVLRRSNGAGARQNPRSTECSDTESLPMDEANAPPIVTPGSVPDSNQDFHIADDLEEHAYRLIDCSRKAARLLRETRNETEWPEPGQTRQSSSSSGLGARRDSISGLSTQSQPFVGGGANYNSLGLQSPSPSYRSQGNYAPGVASAVVADMREVLRVREEGMAEHVKLVVNKELLSSQQQMSRVQTDMADMKRDIQALRTGAESFTGRLHALEKECHMLAANSSAQQTQLLALSMRIPEPALSVPVPSVLTPHRNPPPVPVPQLMVQNVFRQLQQQLQLRQQVEQLQQMHPPEHQQQHAAELLPQASTSRSSFMQPMGRYHSSQQPTQMSSRRSVSSATDSRDNSVSPGNLQLQPGDIIHLEPFVFGETVTNFPNATSSSRASSNSSAAAYPVPPMMLELEQQELQLRRDLQNALAVKARHQNRIQVLQNSLQSICDELNIPVDSIPLISLSRGTVEESDEEQDEDPAPNIISKGPVTDL